MHEFTLLVPAPILKMTSPFLILMYVLLLHALLRHVLLLPVLLLPGRSSPVHRLSQGGEQAGGPLGEGGRRGRGRRVVVVLKEQVTVEQNSKAF